MAWILTALIMVGAAALRLPLLDVPLDRDEGEYAYVARLLLDGIRRPQHEDARHLRGLQRAPHGVRQHAHRHSSGAPVRQRAVDRAGVPPRPKADGCNGRRRRGRYLCVAHPQRDRAGLGRQCRALRRSPRAECAGAARLGIVDDEVAICEALTAFLAEQGHQVRYATNGEGAVAQALHADLAICDLRLGSENGLDVIERLRRVRPELKILVLTAYPSIDALQTATNLGVAGFLSKPLGMPEPPVLGRQGAGLGARALPALPVGAEG